MSEMSTTLETDATVVALANGRALARPSHQGNTPAIPRAGSEVAIPGESETGLNLPVGISFDAWDGIKSELLSRASRVAKNETVTKWLLGDWWQYGDRSYGENVAAQALDPDNKLLRKVQSHYSWVCGAIAPERRRSDLSFAHHEIVAGMEPEAQDMWLETAAQEGWGTRELRAAIKEANGLSDTDTISLVEPPDELAVTLEEDGSISAMKYGEHFCVTHGASRDAFLDVAGRRFRFFAVNGVRITEQKVEGAA